MTVFRSLLIGALALAAAIPLRALLAGKRPRIRYVVWVLLLLPYLTPVLLTGYAYANFSLSLVHHPLLNTVFYAVLVWLKLTPLAVLVLCFAPPPVSTEAAHCHRLLWRTRFDEWTFRFQAGYARGPLSAFALVFLFAFSEFEMASLIGVNSWTVSLFDAHAGGLPLGESLQRMLWPLAWEVVALAIAVAALAQHRVSPGRMATRSGGMHVIAWSHLTVAVALVLLIPATIVLWGTIHGLTVVLKSFALGREVVASLLFASAATFLTSLVAFWWSRSSRGRRGRAATITNAVLRCVIVAGLLGPLVLSLVILAGVQLAGVRVLRDTPIPLVVALSLMLLPSAVVLRLALQMTRPGASLHLAMLMRPSLAARDLIWRLKTSGEFRAVVLLFIWAYWDLTASAILAPITMTPVTVRLYNLMHYGQTAAMSAMLCASFAAPVLVLLIIFGTRHWWAR